MYVLNSDKIEYIFINTIDFLLINKENLIKFFPSWFYILASFFFNIILFLRSA